MWLLIGFDLDFLHSHNDTESDDGQVIIQLHILQGLLYL